MLRHIYFSPTGAVRKTTNEIAAALSGALGMEAEKTDWTLPAGRQTIPAFGPGDVLLLGFPVYEGRVPELLYPALAALAGNGTPAVVAAVFGNRAFDDALLEMGDILEKQGFALAAAGAFVAEHDFTAKLGTGRPDEKDLALAAGFGRSAAQPVQLALEGQPPAPLALEGGRPYQDRFYKGGIAPTVLENCTRCGACATVCPAGAISPATPGQSDKELCISCTACVRACPEGARLFDHRFLTKVREFIEENFAEPAEATLFLPQ